MISVGDLLCDLCVSVFQKFCRSKLSAEVIAVNAKFETQRHRDHREISEGPGSTEFEGIKECKGSGVISATPPSLPRWIWASALRTDLTTQGRSAEARFHRDKLEGSKGNARGRCILRRGTRTLAASATERRMRRGRDDFCDPTELASVDLGLCTTYGSRDAGT